MHWVAVAVNLGKWTEETFLWRDVFSGEELFPKRKKALQKGQAMHICTVPALWSLSVSIMHGVQLKPIFLHHKIYDKNKAEDGYLRPVRFYRSDVNAFHESTERQASNTQSTSLFPRTEPKKGHPTNKLPKSTTNFQTWEFLFYKFLLTIQNDVECLPTILTLTICDLAAQKNGSNRRNNHFGKNVADYACVLSNLPYHKTIAADTARDVRSLLTPHNTKLDRREEGGRKITRDEISSTNLRLPDPERLTCYPLRFAIAEKRLQVPWNKTKL